MIFEAPWEIPGILKELIIMAFSNITEEKFNISQYIMFSLHKSIITTFFKYKQNQDRKFL